MLIKSQELTNKIKAFFDNVLRPYIVPISMIFGCAILFFCLNIPKDHSDLLLGDFVFTLGISSFVFSVESRKLDEALGKMLKSSNDHSADSTEFLGILSIILMLVGLMIIGSVWVSPELKLFKIGGITFDTFYSDHFNEIEFSKLWVAQLYTIGALLFFSKANGRGLEKKLAPLYSSIIDAEKETILSDNSSNSE